MCGGGSDGWSSEDPTGSDSEESLKTDSDWEDEPQPQRRQPPKPPLPPGDGTGGDATARTGGYSTRSSASARGFSSNDNVLAAGGTGDVGGNVRPGQLRSLYRGTVESQQAGPGPPTSTAVPGKLRSSAGGHPTMPHFDSAANGSARGPRPPAHQSFAGSFGRPRPAGVPRMQSFIFPKSKTAPDLSIMAAQQREAMQAIAASSGLDLSVGAATAAAVLSGGEPTGPATPVRMVSHMSFGRPRPHGVPKQPEPEPEPEPSVAPPRSILKMPTDMSFDANQIHRDDRNTDEYSDLDDSPSRSRSRSRSRSQSRSRRSRSYSRERSLSRPRDRGTRMLSARSSGSRSSRNRRREFSDDEFSGGDYSDYYSSDEGYNSASSVHSYESKRSSTHRSRAAGHARRHDVPRDTVNPKRTESSSRRGRSSRSASLGKYRGGHDDSDSEREEERDRERRRERRKERRKRRQQEGVVGKVRDTVLIA
eukprot:COSAG02_NODE_2133_length_9721_cov_11.017044_4_plen_478_part_00